jgi:hypothetical protein
MAAPILAALFSNATSASGTSNSSATPNVSPGLDPGRYAFELFFNKKRRKEEAAERKIESAQKDRALGLTGMEFLAQQRQVADKNSRLRKFRTGLFSNNAASTGA